MLDALLPFAATLARNLHHDLGVNESLQSAALAAAAAADNTAKTTARRGRSSYLGERVLGTPDPGAIAATIWLRAAVAALALY
jgi:dihydroxyacetone kinase